MERIFIIAIGLYLLVIALYLLWERIRKRKQNAAKKTVFNPFKSSPKEDIVGKSLFNLRHSLPQATTLITSEKREENTSTFADGKQKSASAAIPSSELDRVFAPPSTDDDFEEYETDNTPPKLESDEDEGENEDYEEGDDAEGMAGERLATGVSFGELVQTAKTVNNHETATPEEKEEAGRVLVEVRKTDMFEQVVSGEPQKKTVVTGLMDDYIAAFIRRKKEAGELTEEPMVKAPKEFDVRSFA